MATSLDVLRTASAEEARQFFADADPEQLVDAVRAADDDLLLELLGRDEVRPAAVTGIVRRLDEYAVAERLADVKGLVRFDLCRRDTLLESRVLEFGAGTLRVLDCDAGSAQADVTITTSLLRFVRLVSGERNAGLEFLGGHLDIDGDEMLAFAVGALFRVPGTNAVALDPTALDPVDVATVLGDASTDHLRKVMGGEIRQVVLGEVFRRLPEYVNPRRAAKVRLTIAFRLTGRADGEVDRYVVSVDRGTTTVTEGEPEDERDATVTCEAHDFLRLATGHLGAVTGVVKGQLKVRGDRGKALQLSSVIDIPSPR
jgi:putative sterol carrier protein